MARAEKDDKLMHRKANESLELLCLGVLNLKVQVSDFSKLRNILCIMYYHVYSTIAWEKPVGVAVLLIPHAT